MESQTLIAVNNVEASSKWYQFTEFKKWTWWESI